MTYGEPAPRLKIERATEHFHALQDEQRRHLAEVNADPPRVVNQIETDDNGKDWWVVRVTNTATMPITAALILGDLTHNARSALDHLAFQLYLDNGGAVDAADAGTVAFPIFSSAANSDKAERKVRFLSVDHQTAIIELQPYKDPSRLVSQALLWLANVNNIDKHRVVRPVVSVSQGAKPGSVRVLQATAGISPTLTFFPGPHEDGTEIMRSDAIPASHGTVKMQADIGVSITYGEPPIDLPSVGRVIEVVSGIIDCFV